MRTLDLQTYSDLHPAANLALGSLDFGRTRLKAALRDLPEEHLFIKPENFKNSIATLVNHIAAIEVSFSHRIMGKPVPEDLAARFLLDQSQQPLPEPAGVTMAELEDRLATSFQHVYEAFKTIQDEDLERLIPITDKWSYTVQWMMGLLPVHQFLHIGQIQMLRNQL